MLRKILFTLFLLATIGTAFAQPKGGGKGGGNQAQAIKEVKPGLYVITGAGGNSSVRVTSEGIILVDGKLPAEGNYDKLMDLIKSVSNQPIKFMFLTHHHQDHTGNNAKFLEQGIPVIAHENLKSNLVTWLQDKVVIAALKQQNAKHASLNEDEIKKLDKQWRAEVDAAQKPLIDSVIKNELSAFLSKKKDEAKGDKKEEKAKA